MVEWHELHVKLDKEDCVVVCFGELNEKHRIRKFHRGAEKELCVEGFVHTRSTERECRADWVVWGRGRKDMEHMKQK